MLQCSETIAAKAIIHYKAIKEQAKRMRDTILYLKSVLHGYLTQCH
jgi:hypothetical protein